MLLDALHFHSKTGVLLDVLRTPYHSHYYSHLPTSPPTRVHHTHIHPGIPAPSCSTIDPSHHMDTQGGGAGAVSNVTSWEACRALCCANPKCGTYTYVNGSKAPNDKTCYQRDMASSV